MAFFDKRTKGGREVAKSVRELKGMLWLFGIVTVIIVGMFLYLAVVEGVEYISNFFS
ncbi:MAG: hypothetical protein QGI42_01765 [Rhodospirillales bacterium]|jgi:hypothetical protein|nr:hypothetical protein [Rhodospirillales bacterium]HJN23842.1 hypothetical protein [Rhodospirillales bacterium]|tara:strand:- start:312 stop:482 length:171 start_codon:yes stop_codon:yes gene_type:complete